MFYRSYGKLDTNNYSIHKFNDGLLDFETDTQWGGSEYQYTDTTKAELRGRDGNGVVGQGTANIFRRYRYVGDKIIYAIDGASLGEKDSSDEYYKNKEGYESVKKFCYYSDGKLKLKNQYYLDGKFLLGIINYDSLINYVIKEYGEDCKDEKLNTDNNVTYYMFNNERIVIGYYPAKDYISWSNPNLSDSIYAENKIGEIQTIGFENFSKKYFRGTVYNKIIDDRYETIKNNQLLINRKPVNEFLASIGKKNTKYLIFEIADNYFLFYKTLNPQATSNSQNFYQTMYFEFILRQI